MKHKQVIITVFAIIVAIALLKNNVQPVHFRSADPAAQVDNFYKGQLLLPDYAHDDSLLVVEPELLQKGIENCATDQEINVELHKHCVTPNALDMFTLGKEETKNIFQTI